MGARQKDWARRLRAKIIKELGGKCNCGCGGVDRLELDCIVPMENNHGSWDYDKRISFYRDQMREDNLQVLTKKCHTKKNRKEALERNKKHSEKHPELHFDDDNTPF